MYKRCFVPLLAAFTCFQLYFGIIPGLTSTQSDFPNYYVSARLLFEKNKEVKLYDNDWFQDQIDLNGIDAKGKFSPFPPPTAFILAPLAGMNPLTAKRIWLFINLVLIFFCAVLIRKISAINFRDSLLLILCSGIALANTLMLGQVYILLLLSMLLSYYLLKNKNDLSPGLLLGAGIAIKYFPVIYMPSLLYERRWKTITAIILTIFLSNLAALLIFGLNTYKDFFDTVFFQHLNGKLEGQSPWSFAFQSWNALAHNLFKFHPIENPEPLFNSVIFFNVFKYGIQFSILAFSLSIFNKLRRQTHFFETAIILSSVTVLFLTPAGATYHNLLLLLPITLFIKMINSSDPKHLWVFFILISCLVLTGLLPLLQNRIGVFNSILAFSFYRLWIQAIIFLTFTYWLLSGEKSMQ